MIRRRAVLRATGLAAATLAVPGTASGSPPVDPTGSTGTAEDRTGSPTGEDGSGFEEVARWRPADHDDRWGGLWDSGTTIHDVTVVGDRAYAAYWDAGAWILDVSDPSDPAFLGRAGHYSFEAFRDLATADRNRRSAAALEAPGNAHYVDATADGDLVAVGAEGWDAERTGARGPGGIRLFDATDPAEPSLSARIPPPRAADETWAGTWVTAHNFAVVGDRLYSSWYQGGVTIHDVSDPGDPALLAWWRDPAEARFWAARPLAGDAVLASSLAHDGTRGALYVFPDRPGRQPDPPSLGVEPRGRPPEGGEPFEPMATLDVAGTTEAVVDDAGETAYVATGDGFAVVDVAEPADPTLLAERRDLLSDRETGPLGRIRDVAVADDRLVVPGSGRRGPLDGLLVYDVADPTDPRQVGDFYETGFGIHNADLADGYAYLTGNDLPGNPVVVVDVSPGSGATPTRTRTPTPPPAPTPTPVPPPSPTPTQAATGTTATATTGNPDADGGSAPGFGTIATLGGIGLGACRYIRRDDGE